MEKEVINVILNINGKNEEAILIIMIGDDSLMITLESEFCSITKEGENLFDILCQIRIELEKMSVKLLCKGSCRNVRPSAMILSMGYGRMAYSLGMGKQASKDSLVDIFSPCSIEEYSTVREQSDFFKEWCDSIGK